MTNNSTVIRNAWHFHFRLSLVFTALCFSSVAALLTR
ncbi:DUF3265 domain-containing protein [Vibrio vulnificus]|nr:DUF3265 domain-containing protein [Vibrio vulnificus]MDK2644473.1 DUF3265 domain-containing protein [Vibrio vulnificus]MDK2670503.1 DUF3265 domain-containing protein [Vibrio vulnificus]